MDEKTLNDKIAKLKQQLEQTVAEANRQIGFLQGQIALLEQMKAEQPKPDAPTTP